MAHVVNAKHVHIYYDIGLTGAVRADRREDGACRQCGDVLYRGQGAGTAPARGTAQTARARLECYSTPRVLLLSLIHI